VSVIRFNAPWIVAFQEDEHRILRDGCVVVDGTEVSYVGPDFTGHADETIDCPDRMITPGLISTHAHLHYSPTDRSLMEDADRRQFWGSTLYEITNVVSDTLDEDDIQRCVDYSLVEHVRSGATTVVELGEHGDYVADAVERSGLRVYIGEMFSSARWHVPDGKRLEYVWDEPGGLKGLERAVDSVRRLEGRAGDRVRGILSPAQVDTCSEQLLRLSREAADDLRVPLTVHTAQGMVEFVEVTLRHGLTPVEWLARLGFLGERCILGHVVYIAGSSLVNFAGNDLALLAESGTAVSHNAWVFARTGILAESYPDYLAAGVNVCLGTDTVPQSMIEAMRWTAMLGKVASRRADVSTARQVFDSATLSAARALQRSDLGRLAPGAKADLLFWRTDSVSMTPMRDPIRNIVYSAESEDLRDVMIDGKWVMRNREFLTMDVSPALDGVNRAGEHVWSRWPQSDWGSREIDELSHMSYAPYEL
jgi:5-methylthioadenosine/S-adenosylhomocysteine deaminase